MPNKKAKGLRRKSRDKLKSRAKVTVNKILQEIPIGAKVDVIIESSVQDGMPHQNYHGKTGTVIGKQGNAFKVALKNGNQQRELVIGPEHLRISKGYTQKKVVEVKELVEEKGEFEEENEKEEVKAVA